MDSAAAKAEEVAAAAYQSSEAKQARLQSMLAALLDDPILADVPRKPTLADVDTLMNLELGSAMRVTVVKLDNTSFDVAVSNSATVKDLKLAIRKKINEIEQEKMGHRHISWKHVWDNYCLTHHNEKLMDDNSALSSHAIRNNSKTVSRSASRHTSCPECIESTLEEENTASSMVLTGNCDNIIGVFELRSVESSWCQGMMSSINISKEDGYFRNKEHLEL
ncbi:hypothetical protein ACP70R_010502 [Stipagrostis hirtigluma subsp. patula]